MQQLWQHKLDITYTILTYKTAATVLQSHRRILAKTKRVSQSHTNTQTSALNQ